MFPSFKVAVLAALVGYPSLPLSPQDRYSEFDAVIRSTREVSQHTRARQIADTYDQQFSRNSRPTLEFATIFRRRCFIPRCQ